jgi:hypothetical protein
MSKMEEFIEHLSNNLDKLSEYLQIEEGSEFYITDFQGQSYIIQRIDTENQILTIKMDGGEHIENSFDDSKIFTIKNAQSIGFIPIDGKNGFLGFGVSHCDFVFFDEQDFCFVEFKLNTTSIEERAVRKRRKEALGQLKNTINHFNISLKDNYQGLSLEAYICTPDTYPRNDTAWQALAVSFLEEKGIPIFETREKTCK